MGDPRLEDFKLAAEWDLRTINVFMNIEQCCKVYHDIRASGVAPKIVVENSNQMTTTEVESA